MPETYNVSIKVAQTQNIPFYVINKILQREEHKYCTKLHWMQIFLSNKFKISENLNKFCYFSFHCTKLQISKNEDKIFSSDVWCTLALAWIITSTLITQHQ